MYLTVNLPCHIAKLGGVILLTASRMIIHLLKCTGSPPHLLMRLHGPQIRSLLLFWKPLIPLTSLPDSISPDLKHQQVRYSHILPIVVADNPILSIALLLLNIFTGHSTV